MMQKRLSRRKPLPQGKMSVPMLWQLAKRRGSSATRAHIENAISRGEIRGAEHDSTHRAGRIIFPVSEGKRFLREFALRSPSKNFVTVPEAARIIRRSGATLHRSELEKIIDRGLISGARLAFSPKHGRVLSREVVQMIIENLKTGNPATHGLMLEEPVIGRHKTGYPVNAAVAKKIAAAATGMRTAAKKQAAAIPRAASKPAGAVPVSEQEQEKNFPGKPKPPDNKTQNLALVEKWLERNAHGLSEGKKQFILNRIVKPNADLPPAEFDTIVMSIVRGML
ncbi:MAG TPA: hypothetical protein VI977_06640 [archaeon]|nr:hypothetical protein [archaeon]